MESKRERWSAALTRAASRSPLVEYCRAPPGDKTARDGGSSHERHCYHRPPTVPPGHDMVRGGGLDVVAAANRSARPRHGAQRRGRRRGRDGSTSSTRNLRRKQKEGRPGRKDQKQAEKKGKDRNRIPTSQPGASAYPNP
jgi:hypothetical protein